LVQKSRIQASSHQDHSSGHQSLAFSRMERKAYIVVSDHYGYIYSMLYCVRSHLKFKISWRAWPYVQTHPVTPTQQYLLDLPHEKSQGNLATWLTD